MDKYKLISFNFFLVWPWQGPPDQAVEGWGGGDKPSPSSPTTAKYAEKFFLNSQALGSKYKM